MNIKILTWPLAGIITLCCSQSVSAQSAFPQQQAEIMKNNLSLQALSSATSALKEDNLTGLNLANPEVGLSYMFGSPSDVPNRTNVEVSQSFDFATLSGAKRRVAKADNTVAEASFLTSRSAIALEVENALISYTYQLTLVNELQTQYNDVQALLKHAKLSLEQGALTQIEYNKIELEGLALKNDLTMAQVDMEAAKADLIRLNGGNPLSSWPTVWPDASLPVSFQDWVKEAANTNPELISLQAELMRAKEEINLRKKEGLPEFSIGYANELVQGSNYHGATIGFSLPLWGNSGRVKAAKASYAAAQVTLQTATDQFLCQKQNEFKKAELLLNTARQYEEMYTGIRTNGETYLKQAVDAGRITMFEYMTQREDFFEHALKRLEAQRAFQEARAALYAPTL